MADKEQTIAAYNAGAQELANKFNNLGARVDDIKKAFSYISHPNPKVLELGFGSGRDAREITKFTTDYLGLDYSEGLVNLAKQATPEANFQAADFETYEFPQNLDIIFAFASLLHSDKTTMANILNRASRSLNIGGIFFVSLKHGQYHEEVQVEDFGTRTFYFYRPEDIINLSPADLKPVFRDIQDLRGQKWFTIILQKLNETK